jgi:translation elongation factor P/translation initiation factor 5A
VNIVSGSAARHIQPSRSLSISGDPTQAIELKKRDIFVRKGTLHSVGLSECSFTGKLWKVVDYKHVSQGRGAGIHHTFLVGYTSLYGAGYIQIEMVDILKGNKANERFRSDEEVEGVHVLITTTTYLCLY